jgi:hypothetical protein
MGLRVPQCVTARHSLEATTGEEPFPSEIILGMKSEWNERSVVPGSHFRDAGSQNPDITAIVLASPAE